MLASGVGNYQQPDAKRVMAKFLTEHPQIDAVLSANDGMALGALEALKDANRSAIVIGINGILPAVKQIETGAMLASVDFNMFKIGCVATRAAVRQLKARAAAGKDNSAGRGHRQDQLQGLADAGGAAHLPGMGRSCKVARHERAGASSRCHRARRGRLGRRRDGGRTGAPATRSPIAITLIDKAAENEAGGNTRWSPSNMRMASPERVEPNFVHDMLTATQFRGDESYFARLSAGRAGDRQVAAIARHRIYPTALLPVERPAAHPAGRRRRES